MLTKFRHNKLTMDPNEYDRRKDTEFEFVLSGKGEVEIKGTLHLPESKKLEWKFPKKSPPAPRSNKSYMKTLLLTITRGKFKNCLRILHSDKVSEELIKTTKKISSKMQCKMENT